MASQFNATEKEVDAMEAKMQTLRAQVMQKESEIQELVEQTHDPR